MVAEEIMRFALYKEVLKRRKKPKKKYSVAGEDSDESEGEETDAENEVSERMENPKPATEQSLPKPGRGGTPSHADKDGFMTVDAAVVPTGGINPERSVDQRLANPGAYCA